MKALRKLSAALACAALLAGLSLITASAGQGDVAGNYYSTDIKTSMYFSPVTSYNIGGKTVIDAEILNWHYGFDVYWYADTRRLEITDKGGEFNSLQALSGELCQSTGGVPGAVAGQYYETDIVTTLNGKEIESYNIGGRTCIVAEAMRDFGYTVDWNPGARTLTITKPADFYKIQTDYGTIGTRYNYSRPDIFFTKHSRGILLSDKDLTKHELAIPSNSVLVDSYGVSYVRLSDLCSVLKATCTLQQSTATEEAPGLKRIPYQETYYTYSLAFDYDKNTALTLKPGQPDYPSDTSQYPTGGAYYKISTIPMSINGASGPIVLRMGGQEYPDGITVINEALYIPTFMAAKLLGYFSAE